jgi:hypothetical protein
LNLAILSLRHQLYCPIRSLKRMFLLHRLSSLSPLNPRLPSLSLPNPHLPTLSPLNLHPLVLSPLNPNLPNPLLSLHLAKLQAIAGNFQ